MSITIRSDKGNIIFVFHLFFSIIIISLLLYTLSIPAHILLAIMCICIVMVVRYWIAIGRTITLEHNSIEISFLGYKRKYLWDQVCLKSLFECNNCFGYRSAYSSGVELSFKKLIRPSWIQPIQYCILCHPFSYVVIHFPITESAPIKYPSIYEIDRDILISMLNEWEQGIGQGDGSVVS